MDMRIGHGAAFKNSQKTGFIESLFESSDHPDSPQITSVHAGCRGFAGVTTYVQPLSPGKSKLRLEHIAAVI
jgi:hypothetical protein